MVTQNASPYNCPANGGCTVQEEAERLEIQHRVFQRVFDDRLVFPPIPRLRRVLDCGYGSGSWAAETAEQYPNCEVKRPEAI